MKPSKPVRGRRKTVTIRDVAREAGVSIGTASTALNGSQSTVVLSEATRLRVLEAARKLHYRPNAAARAMAGRRFRTLGILTTEEGMSGSYYGNVLRAIATEAHDAGYNLMLKVVASANDMPDASMLTEQQIDGVIIPSNVEDRTIAALRQYEIPHVWMNTNRFGKRNCVQVDEAGGVDLAIEHLHRLGHRYIAYVPHNVPDRHFLTETRQQAYVDSMTRRGLKPVATYNQQIDIARHLDEYLAMRPTPTALVVFSDAMALLVVNRLVELEVEIPRRMSVVSAESIVLYTLGYRQVSGVMTPVEDLGRTAVRLLIRQIETGEPADSVVIKPTFADRETTAPPPK